MVDSNSLHVDRELKVMAFRDAFSDIHAHNHLIRAYDKAGAYWLSPPYWLMWRVPAICVPNAVLLLVDADSIVDVLREKLGFARALIEEMKPSLDHGVERLVHSASRPYDNLPANLVTAHRSTPGHTPDWSYTFNAYRLAIAMLDEYEYFITTVMQSRKTPFTQVSLICQKAKAFGGRVNMVASAMQ